MGSLFLLGLLVSKVKFGMTQLRTHSSYAISQPTVASDICLVRRFCRSVSSVLELSIGKVRGLNLSPLRVCPPQSGLTLAVTAQTVRKAEKARPIRVANDLTCPFRLT